MDLDLPEYSLCFQPAAHPLEVQYAAWLLDGLLSRTHDPERNVIMVQKPGSEVQRYRILR